MYILTKQLWRRLPLLLASCALSLISHPAISQGLTIYTPFTKISVPPGESINYSIDVINNSSSVKRGDIVISRLPKGWTYTLNSGGWAVKQVAVLPGDKKNLSLQVQVPFKVNKGAYRFYVSAGGSSLPLTVIVSEQGTYKTGLTSSQSNMEGAANSTFTFNSTLRNQTAEDQVYALNASALPGWGVTFKANYKQVSSVKVEANKTQDLTIEVDPPDQIKAGTYKIPVLAHSKNTSAKLELEVGITGSYDIELTTPTGLLSTSITAGDEKKLTLEVRNTGSADLKNIEFKSNAPADWEVSFDPSKIESLPSGKSAQVTAVIKAAKKAIAGDYVTELTASTPEKSSTVSIRTAVETSMLWGWLGILIILIAAGAVYYLFKTYGRR